jgi:integrase
MARRPEGWKVRCYDGWYYVRFTHERREYKIALGTKNSGEAAAKAPVLYAEVIQGKRPTSRLTSSVNTPLDELVALWLDGLAAPGGLDERTIHSYLCYARAQWLPRWERLGQLNAAALRGYIRERLGQVARSTVRKEASAMRGFLGWARDQDLLQEVPLVELPRRAAGVRQRDRKPVPLSPEEVRAILAQLPERNRAGAPVRGYAEFLWETGLRPATVEVLSVPGSWAPGRTELQITDDEDKARWGRMVPLSRRALELLASHAPPSGKIWGRPRLGERLKEAALAAGLTPERARRVAPYDLRHARLTALAEAGASRGALQLLAGHTQAATTERYLHGVEGAARAALEALREVAVCSTLEGEAEGFPSEFPSVCPGEGGQCEGVKREVCSLPRLRGAQGGT